MTSPAGWRSRGLPDDMTTWINVGPGQFPAPTPWINVDVHEGDGVVTDVVIPEDQFLRPLDGWDDGTVDRVYLGHVLEHVPWPEVGPFLCDIHRALAPGGEVCVVGPDVLRVIRRWRDGVDPEGWSLVESVLENPWDRCYDADGPAYGLIRTDPRWPYARHWWNCTETRVMHAFAAYTPFVDVTPQPINEQALGSWPLVAYTQWQCAVTARR